MTGVAVSLTKITLVLSHTVGVLATYSVTHSFTTEYFFKAHPLLGMWTNAIDVNVESSISESAEYVPESTVISQVCAFYHRSGET